MLRCYITDRRLLPSGADLLAVIARNLADGIEWIQVREKDLPARDLFDLVTSALALPVFRRVPTHSASKILVNTSVDVAIAAGAHGAHLPSGSPPPRNWRRLAPAGFLFGVSCHTIEEVQIAEAEEADYVVFGPVFTPRSKIMRLPARGLIGLHDAAHAVKIPVLALGGISEDNAQSCVDVGAAGIAAISMFQP